METVGDWIVRHEGEFLEDLKRWIRYPSISRKGEAGYPFGKACYDMLREALACAQRFGLSTRDFDGYCGTASIPGRTRDAIGLFSHLDVVPEGSGWWHDPYTMSVKHGMICGRGCADDKGPALAALYALRYLLGTDCKFRHSISLFFGCNEEAGMEDIGYYVKRKESLPVFSLVTDGKFSACVGEKGHIIVRASRPVNGHYLLSFSTGDVPNSVPDKAEAHLAWPLEKVEKALQGRGIPFAAHPLREGFTCLTVQGRSAHAAFPEGSLHAQKQLACLLCGSGLLDAEEEQALQAVAAFLEDDYGTGLGIAYQTPEFGKLTMISGITRWEENQFTVVFDIRYPVGFPTTWAQEKMESKLKSWGFSLESWKDSPGYYRDPSLPVLQEIKRIAERVWERELPFYVMGGGTYARMLPNAVPFGPGLPGAAGREMVGRAHQANEGIRLEELEKGIEIYVETLLALDRILN